MNNVKIKIWVMMLVCYLALPKIANAIITYSSGGPYDIFNNSITETVWVKGNVTLNLLENGHIAGELHGFENSIINVSGGSTNSSLIGSDSSNITVSSGGIGFNLDAYNESQVSMSGGTINHMLHTYDSSSVIISGGTIKQGSANGNSNIIISGGTIKNLISPNDKFYAHAESNIIITGGVIDIPLYADGQGVITFKGTNFAINGNYVSYGEYDRGELSHFDGTITGTLAHGDYLNTQFSLSDDSRIVLVPEPASLLLFGLGAVMLRKKR